MSHNGKANSGPTDFLHLLKRRRVSFDRWASHEGLTTQEAFAEWKTSLEEKGEFFVSEEFQGLARSLPHRVPTTVPVESLVELKPEPEEFKEEEAMPTVMEFDGTSTTKARKRTPKQV